MANRTRTARITVKAYANQACLAALVWNALIRKYNDTEDAARAFVDKPLTLVATRDIVRRELALYGLVSVECGPTVDYYTPEVERAVRALVSRAFNVVDSE